MPGVSSESEPGGVLFRRAADASLAGATEPPCFRDLNLDQVVRDVTRGREEYRLDAYFHVLLTDLDSIAFRHEVGRDLEGKTVRAPIERFAAGLLTVRQRLSEAGKRRDPIQRQRWHLGAAQTYCDAVLELERELRPLRLASRALLAFRAYLAAHLQSDAFTRLSEEARGIGSGLADVRYDLHLFGTTITVTEHGGGEDYGAEVERTFARFRKSAGRDYRVGFPPWPDLNPVEAQVLDRVARLHPVLFGRLAAFSTEHAEFQDPGILRFDREIQFYLSWLEHTEALARSGITFCYPSLSLAPGSVALRDGFDVALAWRLAAEQEPVVLNDVELRGRERLIVVTGPNQGGKTTFARMVGQAHHLAALGLTVPGREARLSLCDRVLTHFEREEEAASQRGKLRDDLVRIRGVLDQATRRSVLVLNEVFASTTVDDASFLSRRILERVSGMDVVAVCVTFLSELSTFDAKTVSYVGTVDPDEPTVRTFKVLRAAADGLAHALAIAEKHRVTHEWITRRLGS